MQTHTVSKKVIPLYRKKKQALFMIISTQNTLPCLCKCILRGVLKSSLAPAFQAYSGQMKPGRTSDVLCSLHPPPLPFITLSLPQASASTGTEYVLSFSTVF